MKVKIAHQSVNQSTLLTRAHMKKQQQTHRKADVGETPTIGGETSSVWAKRPGAKRPRGETSSERTKRPGAKRQRVETSCYRHVILIPY